MCFGSLHAFVFAFHENAYFYFTPVTTFVAA